MQRALQSLFLQLNNCDVIEQKTYGGIALKGDILNHPEVLNEANLIGERLVSALKGKRLYDPVAHYEENYLICPVCKGDLFQIQSNGQMSCGICGADLQKRGLVNHHYETVTTGKFTKEGAREHTHYVGGRILTGMELAEETARRLKLFLNYHSYALANGVFLGKVKIWETILLGVLAAVCTYSIVFVANYFFMIDFRFTSHLLHL